jgi:hypothetical protein
VVDSSLLTTAISTCGALFGALGGIGLTYRANSRQEAAQADRQRRESRAQERRQAYLDLLGTATQIRIEIIVAGQRNWRDMEARLAAIQQHASAAGLHASRVALVAAEEVGRAARALADAATALGAATARQADLGYQGTQFVGGNVVGTIDFGELERCLEAFVRAARQADAAG